MQLINPRSWYGAFVCVCVEYGVRMFVYLKHNKLFALVAEVKILYINWACLSADTLIIVTIYSFCVGQDE